MVLELWGLPGDNLSLSMPYNQVWLYVFLVILRIPGMIILDIWWVLCLPNCLPKALDLFSLADSGMNLSVLLVSLLILLLPMHNLVSCYLHAISAGLLGVSYLFAVQFSKEERAFDPEALEGWDWDFWRRHMCPVASYLTITKFIAWLLDLKHPIYRRLLPAVYVLPILMSYPLRILGLPIDFLKIATDLVTVFGLLLIWLYGALKISHCCGYIYQTKLVYSIVIDELGKFRLLVIVIRRMLEPAVMASYWLSLLLIQSWSNYHGLTDKNYVISDKEWYINAIVVMSEICETPISLISFCITVMAMSHVALSGTRRFLNSCGGPVGPGNPMQTSGLTEGVVAYILALQTGLIDIEMPARIGALSIILFIVVASLVQSIYEVTHPVLLALSAANRRPIHHVKVLLLTLVLLLAPGYMTYAMLTKVSTDMWTIVVISSCVVTVVQVLGTFVNYFLFLWDSFQETPSEFMDDYVYYIKSTTRAIEFFLAVAIVSSGLYEAATSKEELSVLNSGILLVHCYFNIYVRLSAGWKTYLNRRKAIQRLSSLKDATTEELSLHDDVCAICYQPMVIAKVTNCRHYFHGFCLRRWLFIQDNCPMCLVNIVQTKEIEGEEEDDSGVEEETDTEVEEGDNDNVDNSGLRRRNPVVNLFDGD